jgi:arsenate reductase-like glutaredoxin family protein
MAGTLEVAFKLIGVLMTLFFVYMVVAGSVTLALYTRIGQGDPKGFWYTDRDKLNKYIFKSWIDWAGSPSTFSMKESTAPVSYTTYKTLTGNNIVSNCMLQCEAANDRGKTPKCVGFIYTPGTSNTCNLVSTMDGLITTTTPDTTYFIDGLDTAREYKEYTSNTQADATFIDTSSTGDQREYLSNCVSLSDCTGVQTILNGTRTTYKLVKNMDPTKFTADTNSKMSYLTTHGPLKASTITYY